MADGQQADPGNTPTPVRPRESFQARCANDAVVVFGDAFATEELPALRAARNGLPGFMVQAALVRDGGHAVLRRLL